MLTIVPMSISDAKVFVKRHHRHADPPLSGLFAIGLARDDEEIVGCAIVGRPVARNLQDGWTAEVTRLCTDGSRNACSKLYGAAWRAARSMGYRKLVTYIRDTEPGTSLIAAGFELIAEVYPRGWNCQSRPRVDRHPAQRKLRFERTA